jgi:hypothetical protein
MKMQRGASTGLHTLFVEGKDGQEIDPVVMKELLHNNGLTAIEVQAMDACDNVRSAAQALIKQHPSYYFLIDRDDQECSAVEQSWAKFPDPAAYNMLIWRKRELENYFIDPDYLGQSKYLKAGVDIRQRILDECNRRLFLDAANLTLYALGRQLRKPLAIPHFADPLQFKNKQAGMSQLSQLAGLVGKRAEVADILRQDTIEGIYARFVAELSGGTLPLQYGLGTWLERMSGKEIFRVVANECFQVKTIANEQLQGKEKYQQIARDLVKLPLEQQPTDFQDIVGLLQARLGGF